MQLEDIISGEYYAAHYEDESHPTIIKASEGGSFNNSLAIYTRSRCTTYRFSSGNWSAATHNIRLATPQEIHWLDCCIDNDKFISYEQAMLTYVEPIISYQQDSEYNNILIKLLTT